MRRATLPLLLVTAALALRTSAAGPPEPTRDALAVQEARTKFNNARRTERFYTRNWDLSGLPSYLPRRHVSGTLRVWGDDAVTNGMLGRYWIEEFGRFQPDLVLDLDLKSSAVALPALTTGAADIGIGRHAMFMELLGYERLHGCDPLEIVGLNGAYDALGWNPGYVIVVNKDNPIDRLTLSQLDGIFGAERSGGWVGTTWHPEFARGPERNLRTWGQLGLGGRWRSAPVHVYAMNLEYNPSVDFNRLVLRGSGKWNETVRQYSQFVRPDGALALGAQELVKDIGRDVLGIGVSCVGYLTVHTKALALAAADGGPYVPPTIERFQDRSYPLHGQCYFYLWRERGKPLNPAAEEFVRFALSREGQEAVVRDGKFLPMPADAARTELAKLDAADPSPAERAAREVAPYRPERIVSGVLRLWGHGSFQRPFMRRLVTYWERGFRRFHPRARIEYDMYGTSSAIPALYAGVADLLILGEELDPGDARVFRQVLGFDLQSVQVATGSLAVRNADYAQMFFVHRDNPLRRITLAQLDGIFGTEHRRGGRNLRVWGDLGLGGPWAHRPIHPYGWAIDDSFGIYLQRALLGGSHRWNCELREFRHVTRPDGSIYDHGQQILDALARDPDGIAVSNLRYAGRRVKALALAASDGGPYVPAAEDTLIAETYPLTRLIPACFVRRPGEPLDPKVREFLRYLLSREGQQDIVRDGSYLPLRPDVAAAELAKLD